MIPTPGRMFDLQKFVGRDSAQKVQAEPAASVGYRVATLTVLNVWIFDLLTSLTKFEFDLSLRRPAEDSSTWAVI